MSDIDKDSEINLLELAKKLWTKKRFILKWSLLGLALGIIIAFSIPKEYTTTVILAPETQSTPIGKFGSLAALAGINISNTSNVSVLASPELYPDIFNSTPFIKELLEIRVKNLKGNINTTLYEYLKEYQNSTWWSYILNTPSYLKELLFSNSQTTETEISQEQNTRFISQEEMSIIKNIRNRISIDSDKKTGVITINIQMQDPRISAFLADTITSYLQKYIIEYRTQKSKRDLEYTEKLYNESKKDYYKAQKNLATFIDENLNVVSAKYRTTQERLQNEANLTYDIYNQTAQQLQIAKMKVQDTTPVFTVIQPSIEQISPSKPNKKLILMVFIFLPFLGSSLWILRGNFFNISQKDNCVS